MEGGEERGYYRSHVSATDDRMRLTHLLTNTHPPQPTSTRTPHTHHLANRQCRTGQVHIMTNSQLLYFALLPHTHSQHGRHQSRVPCLCGLCKQFESALTPETIVCPDSLSVGETCSLSGGTSASLPCQNNLGGWREGEGGREGWGGKGRGGRGGSEGGLGRERERGKGRE